MAKTRIASVDEYITSQPETAQRVLKRVRSIIRKAVPDAQETISYGIPTYKLDGRYVLYFAGWKRTTRCTPPPTAWSQRSRMT